MTLVRRNALGHLSRRHAVAAAAMLAGVAVLSHQPAWAQGPVIIGGSGQPPIEINLDVLSDSASAALGRGWSGRRLLIPGTKRVPGTPIVLRPPTGSRSFATASRRAPVLRPPTRKAPRLKLPTAPKLKPPRTATVSPKPVSPKPVSPKPPALAPRATLKAAPPPPAPAPRIAARPAPAPAAPPRLVPPPPLVPKPTPERPRVSTAPLPPPPTTVPTPSATPRPSAPAPPTAAPTAPVAIEKAPKVAALPPAGLTTIDGDQGLRVLFEGASAEIPGKGREQLAKLARDLSGSETRVQLKAYGGGSSESVSAARRLSLSRALAVRSFLIEQGIRNTRIDVRALGLAKDAGPAERVDIVLLKR